MSEITCVLLMTYVFAKNSFFGLTGSARLAVLSAIEQEEQQPSEERRGSPQANEDEVVDPDGFDHDGKSNRKAMRLPRRMLNSSWKTACV